MDGHNCTPEGLINAIRQTQLTEDLDTLYGDKSLAQTDTTPGQGGAKPPVVEQLDPANTDFGKERGFITSVKESPNTSDELRLRVSGRYTPISNEATLADARTFLNSDPNAHGKVLEVLRDKKQINPLGVTVLQEKMSRLQQEGLAFKQAGDEAKANLLFDEAASIANDLAVYGTKAGQDIQAFSIWGRLTPEGALRWAQKTVNKTNEKIPKATKIVNDATKNQDAIGKTITDALDSADQDIEKAVSNRINKPKNETVNKPKERKASTPKTMEELLAKRVEGAIVPKAQSDQNKSRLLGHLLEISKQYLPEVEKGAKPQKQTLAQFLGDVINNKDKYGEIYDKARHLVGQDIAEGKLTLPDGYDVNNLNDYFKTIFDKPYTSADLEKLVNDNFKPKEIKNLIKQHYLASGGKLAGLEQKLVNEMGLSADDAKQILGEIRPIIDKKINEAKESLLKNYFKEAPERQRKTIVDKTIELYNAGAFENKTYAQQLAKKFKVKTITPEQTSKITSLASEIQTLPEGSNARKVKTAELVAAIGDLQNSGIGQKLSTAQYISMLLNTKTMVRNIVGNTMFSPFEAASDVVATGIDMAISPFTKQRTQVLPKVKATVQGAITGAKEGFSDAVKGIDTVGTNKFDIGKGNAFKNQGWEKPFYWLERVTGGILKASDRVFYEAAKNESLANQMAAKGLKEPTEDMIAQAHLEGLYKTFQDDSHAAELFTGLKRVFNLKQDFGFGDAVLKFAKTPANLMARGFAYTPGGFVKAFGQLSKDIFDLSRGGDKPTEAIQREFVKSLGRATVGTVGPGAMGYLLAKAGLVSGERDSDSDLANIKQQMGQNPNSLNATALARFVLTGMNPEAAKAQDGDIWVSYDWLQPMAIPFMAGVSAARFENKDNPQDIALNFVGGTIQAADSIVDQGMLQGVKTLTSTRDASGDVNPVLGAAKVLAGSPSGFVPTALSQLNQLVDNNQRETYDPNVLKQGLNQAQSKIPGLAQMLPKKVNSLGEYKQRYQDNGNNLLNVLLNPANVTKQKSDDVIKQIMSIYDKTGETQQFPKVVDRSVEVINNGQKVKKQLNGKEFNNYQAINGRMSKILVKLASEDALFNQLDDSQKAQVLSNAYSDADQIAKIILFKHETELGRRGPKSSNVVEGLFANNEQQIRYGLREKIISAYKNQRPKQYIQLGQ